MPDPELIEPDTADTGGIAPDAPPADRIRARISDVVRERRRAETEPPLTNGHGADAPGPGSGALPPEPPLTAGASAAPRLPVAEPRQVVQHAPARPAAPSARAQAEAQPALALDPAEPGLSCRRSRCSRTRPISSAITSARRRSRKMRGCWRTCSTITASRARS